MNITLLANRDLASNLALNILLDGLKNFSLRVFLSEQVGGSKQPIPPLQDLRFFEQRLFNEIVFPAVDRQPVANARLKTFKGLSQSMGRPLASLNDINHPLGLEKLARTEPDLILSVRFGKILRPPAIATAKLGVLNLHSGLLPDYRGVMATFWAMLNREPEYGTTLHYIDSAAIDAGPIISLQRAPLPLEKSYLENVLSLYELGCQQMIEVVQQIAAGPAIALAEPPLGNDGYYSFPQQQDFDAFFAQNGRLFETQHIMSLVKAYQGLE